MSCRWVWLRDILEYFRLQHLMYKSLLDGKAFSTFFALFMACRFLCSFSFLLKITHKLFGFFLGGGGWLGNGGWKVVE